MNFRSFLAAATFIGIVTPVASAQTVSAETRAAADAEGLVKVKVQGLDAVYAQPGANLSSYDKVMLDPIEVSFSKNWKPETAHQPITAKEKQEIREGLEKVVREAFSRELARSERYTVVDAPAEDVLRIKAEIRDLYINAPDLQRAGISRSYTLSAGEMTLVAELRDSATGALIARVIDRKVDPESPWLEWTSRVDNVAAAQRAAASWATVLRKHLDAAHGIGASAK